MILLESFLHILQMYLNIHNTALSSSKKNYFFPQQQQRKLINLFVIYNSSNQYKIVMNENKMFWKYYMNTALLLKKDNTKRDTWNLRKIV